jgi:oxygen-independent coproporphyrinogen-3 oxidase
MIYIHIPFCRSKCAYCDFLSGTADAWGNASEVMAAYSRALITELQTARMGDMENRIISTVYIGGGTPTALPASFLCEIIKEVKRFHLADDAEITVEVNPVTHVFPDVTVFSALRSLGVNRISIGLQAFQDSLLTKIKRAHTVRDFVETFLAARDAGFDNINVDLMFSLPGQTMGDWKESLKRLIVLRPEHISAYSLTPAEGTPLWDGLQNGEINLPDDEADRAMYHEANRILANAGYNRYEISNFALPGRESRHNVNTWKRRPYRGFGLGAHSFEESDCPSSGGCRWHNTEDMGEYLRAWACPPAGGGDSPDEALREAYQRGRGHHPRPPGSENTRKDFTPLTRDEALSETLILGLRLTEGIVLSKIISDRYGAEIAKFIADGLLKRENGYIFLTPLGADLANLVFSAFM